MYYKYCYYHAAPSVEDLLESFENLIDKPLCNKFKVEGDTFKYSQPLVGVNPDNVKVMVTDKVLVIQVGDKVRTKLSLPNELDASTLTWNLIYGQFKLTANRLKSPPGFVVPRR